MLEVKEITDKKIWEGFIEKHYHGSYPFFQSWNWGEVLESLQISISRLGFFEKQTLVGIVMVVDVNAKRGHYLYLRHGPIFVDPQKYFDESLSLIKQLAQEKKVSFIRLSRFLQQEDIPLDYFAKR